MTATGTCFFAPLQRPAEFADRFRELRLAPAGDSSTPTLTPPRDAEGYWKRLRGMGPVALARTSYLQSRQSKLEAVSEFKKRLAQRFGEQIARESAGHLRETRPLRLHEARLVYLDAETRHGLTMCHLFTLADALNTTAGPAVDVKSGAASRRVDAGELAHLPWTEEDLRTFRSEDAPGHRSALARRADQMLLRESDFLTRKADPAQTS